MFFPTGPAPLLDRETSRTSAERSLAPSRPDYWERLNAFRPQTAEPRIYERPATRGGAPSFTDPTPGGMQGFEPVQPPEEAGSGGAEPGNLPERESNPEQEPNPVGPQDSAPPTFPEVPVATPEQPDAPPDLTLTDWGPPTLLELNGEWDPGEGQGYWRAAGDEDWSYFGPGANGELAPGATPMPPVTPTDDAADPTAPQAPQPQDAQPPVVDQNGNPLPTGSQPPSVVQPTDSFFDAYFGPAGPDGYQQSSIDEAFVRQAMLPQAFLQQWAQQGVTGTEGARQAAALGQGWSIDRRYGTLIHDTGSWDQMVQAQNLARISNPAAAQWFSQPPSVQQVQDLARIYRNGLDWTDPRLAQQIQVLPGQGAGYSIYSTDDAATSFQGQHAQALQDSLIGGGGVQTQAPGTAAFMIPAGISIWTKATGDAVINRDGQVEYRDNRLADMDALRAWAMPIDRLGDGSKASDEVIALRLMSGFYDPVTGQPLTDARTGQPVGYLMMKDTDWLTDGQQFEDFYVGLDDFDETGRWNGRRPYDMDAGQVGDSDGNHQWFAPYWGLMTPSDMAQGGTSIDLDQYLTGGESQWGVQRVDAANTAGRWAPLALSIAGAFALPAIAPALAGALGGGMAGAIGSGALSSLMFAVPGAAISGNWDLGSLLLNAATGALGGYAGALRAAGNPVAGALAASGGGLLRGLQDGSLSIEDILAAGGGAFLPQVMPEMGQWGKMLADFGISTALGGDFEQNIMRALLQWAAQAGRA